MADRIAEAEQLYSQGRLTDAQRICEEIVDAEPQSSRASYLLGIIAYKTGDFELAAHRMTEAIRVAPDNPEYLTHAAEVYRRAGDLTRAIDVATKAVNVWPDHPAPQNNLGLALKDAERVSEAEECFRRAIAMNPSYARAQLNLGNVLHGEDRLVEAQACFAAALKLRPDYPEALNSAGQLCKQRGNPTTAVRLLQRAIQLRPGYTKALLNLANAVADLGRLDEAEQILTKLTGANPEYSEAFHDLGALYEKTKRIQDAVTAYGRVLELQPDSPSALAAVENAKRNICDWSGWPESVDRLIEATRKCLAEGKPSPIWPLVSCRFPTTSRDRYQIACNHASRVARHVGTVALVDPAQYRPHPESERIRIGILCHEFRYHVVSHLMFGLFKRFDRTKFEVFAFDYSPDDGSTMRRRIIDDVDHFITVSTGTDRERAERIFAKRIHILLDINSYMPGGRPEIAAHRPAPLQISHMYPATTGAKHIDYFITDPFVSPPGQEQYFTEQLIYLPCCYLPTDSDQSIAEDEPARSECGLPEDGFVFSSFNKSDKIEPNLFDVWMRILTRVPNSVLWLRNDGTAAAKNLRREAKTRGVDPDRLVFAREVPGIPEHLARQRCADLFLDTLTHGAHGTAVDALWAGLPLLTYPGQTFTSRVAASLLTAAGLEELIVDSIAKYEDLAVELASSPERVLELRRRLDDKREQGDLFNTDRYTRNLERALVMIWDRFQDGEEPGPIRVSSDASPIE
jgi:protein O-GlcNAc transferase